MGNIPACCNQTPISADVLDSEAPISLRVADECPEVSYSSDAGRDDSEAEESAIQASTSTTFHNGQSCLDNNRTDKKGESKASPGLETHVASAGVEDLKNLKSGLETPCDNDTLLTSEPDDKVKLDSHDDEDSAKPPNNTSLGNRSSEVQLQSQGDKTPKKIRAKFMLYPYQKEFLDAMAKSKNLAGRPASLQEIIEQAISDEELRTELFDGVHCLRCSSSSPADWILNGMGDKVPHAVVVSATALEFLRSDLLAKVQRIGNPPRMQLLSGPRKANKHKAARICVDWAIGMYGAMADGKIKAANAHDPVWYFGYGPNMSVESARRKVGLEIKDYRQCKLRNYKFAFCDPGPPLVEPAYANVTFYEGAEVHGVALLVTRACLDKLEGHQDNDSKRWVTLVDYEGNELKPAVIFTTFTGLIEGAKPSSRHLRLLVKGAIEAKLAPEYIMELESTPTYVPTDETLSKRKEALDSRDLPWMTVAELANHKSDPCYVSVLGLVVEFDISKYTTFGSHKGRDITTRMLCHANGVSMDKNDDRGRPPYPIISQLGEEELEYVSRWLDSYLHRGSGPIARLKEFHAQQKSGNTKWSRDKWIY